MFCFCHKLFQQQSCLPYVNNVVIEKKLKNKEREKRKERHCEDYNICIVHFKQLPFILLYLQRFMYAAIFFFFFFCSLSLLALLFKFAATVNIRS